ncbi:MAG: peptidoglycan bridge formation glycyltransferase FemA/FemB family protein [Candidatus Limnocylindrales bacterium]
MAPRNATIASEGAAGLRCFSMEESLSLAMGPKSRIDAPGDVNVVDASGWEPSAWDALAVRSPMGEAFQSHAWGELKRGLGWSPLRYAVELGGAPVAVVSIQERPLLGRRGGPLGRYQIHYAPRGPVLLDQAPEAVAAALAGLQRIARDRHSMTMTVDPAWEEGSGSAAALRRAGFRLAARDVQVSRTAMIVPLEPSEAAQRELLGHTTAADLKRAVSLGVTTERIDMADEAAREGALAEFYEIHAATGKREGFIVRARDYEVEQWRRLGEAEVASLWFAGLGGRDTGALLLHSGRLLVYFAAGSRDGADMKRTRANHLLQWEIIRWAAGAGFSAYDMGGVDTQGSPGVPRDETHPLWNLYLFKRRFGGRPVVRVRAHEYAPNPLLGATWRLARRFR